MERRFETVVDDVAFAEGLRWREGALWYSDFGRGQVLRAVPGQAEVVVGGLDLPSGLGWTRGGDLIIATVRDSVVLRVGPDGAAKAWCGPECHRTNLTNDMVTAGDRSYVTCGGVSLDDTAALRNGGPVGKIILLDHDSGACRWAAEGLEYPNGAAITPDGRTLIVNESHGRRISAFDILPDGMLVGRRVLATVAEGSPDGLALDAELGVWIGAIVGFQRYDAAGTLVDEIRIPGWSAVACALGGDDGRTLFMAVADFKDAKAILEGRTRGRILATRVEAPAAPPP